MTDEQKFDSEAVIDAMAPLLGLTIAHDYRQGIATNLAVTALFAALLFDEPIEDHAEPAAVFRP